MSAQAPGTTASIIGGNLMRGSTRIGLLAVSLVCLFALMATAAFSAERRGFDKKGGTALRDVNAIPKNQPDAIEFVNNGTAKLISTAGDIECTELEMGTTLVNNDGVSALRLAIPFGVAEGDNCSLTGVGNVPTYFDTLVNGAVGNTTNGNV